MARAWASAAKEQIALFDKPAFLEVCRVQDALPMNLSAILSLPFRRIDLVQFARK
jgi:hypothetical protein